MATESRSQRVLFIDLGLWIGGLLVGFAVVLLGAALRSNLVVRLGLALIAIGMAASAASRLMSIPANNRFATIISIGFRLAAALLFIYLAIYFHF